jgi:hypothetical protein
VSLDFLEFGLSFTEICDHQTILVLLLSLLLLTRSCLAFLIDFERLQFRLQALALYYNSLEWMFFPIEITLAAYFL